MSDFMDDLSKFLDRIRRHPPVSAKEVISGYSTDSLRKCHAGIRQRLAQEDGLSAHEREYGVREHADWRVWADAFEDELTERKIGYTPIEWEQ